jgi:branched-chain amino acid transport system permease protein
MTTFLQLTVAGLSNGAILALAALGFALIYKATGVLNFAQGELLLVGAYMVYTGIVDFGLPWPAAIGFALVVAVVLGVVVERLILRPMVGRSPVAIIMVTIGLAEVLRSVIHLRFGTAPKRLPGFIPSGAFEIAGVTVPTVRLWAVGLAAVIIVAFSAFFLRTKFGLAMRAVADDQQAAMAMGIDVNRVFAMAWALAGISAVGGGVLLANITGVSGEIAGFGLIVFPVVILGGLESIWGTIAGGVIIGLAVAYSSGYIGNGIQTVIPWLILVAILLIRPYGLFGQEEINRA